MAKVILNGEILERSVVTIDLEDRGYQFGDGVYEVIRVYGGELFTGEEHVERLFASAGKIKLDIPFSREKILSLTRDLVRENGIATGSVYMQATRGTAARTHIFPDPGTVKGVFSAYTTEVPRPEKALENGVAAITAEDIRWLRCDIKSLNLLPNVLAKQEAADQGCYEAILHRSGTVTEGSSSNVFIVTDGKVMTHPADNLILNGITRQVVSKLCAGHNIPLAEEAFRVEDLLKADEIFITSTTSEIMPVVKVDGMEIGNGKPGPVTRRLQQLFENEINHTTGRES
jgi:D-alanine transaminase